MDGGLNTLRIPTYLLYKMENVTEMEELNNKSELIVDVEDPATVIVEEAVNVDSKPKDPIASDEKDDTVVVHVDGEEEEGRYDEFGNFIRNAYHLNYFRNEFQGEEILMPLAVNLTLSTLDTDKETVDFDNVYDCLSEIGMDFEKVLAMDKVGAKTFCLDFCDCDAKKFFLSTIAKSFSEKYKAWALIQDSTKVTISSLPLQIKDDVIFKYLRKFGDIEDENVIYKTHYKHGTYLNERVYTVSKLKYELPSYTWIYGRQLSIRYRKQPHTCKLCDKKGHKAYNCPLKTILMKGMVEKMSSVGVSDANDASSSQSGQKEQEIASYSAKLKKGVFPKPVLGGKHVVNGWNQGGFRPGGFRPQWKGRPFTPAGRTRTSVLGDFMDKGTKLSGRTVATNSSGPSSGAKNKQRPMLSIKIPKNFKRRSIENIGEDGLLINKVDEKVDEIGRIIGDSMFADEHENVDVSKKVHKSLLDLMDICKNDGDDPDEVDFLRQTCPSAFNIRETFEKDLQMLENCQLRIGLPIGSRLRSPAFQSLMKKYFDGLELQENGNRKRPPSSPAGSTPERLGGKHTKSGPRISDGPD